MNRFSDYSLVGELTVTPDDLNEVVGSFSMPEDHDTIWVRVTQLNPPGPWPWSYGILGWQTSSGYELGSIKCFGEQTGEVYRLGVGRPPLVRTGQLTFEPRSFNLAWVKNGYPWTLRFEAVSGESGFGPSGASPVFGTRATLGVVSDLADFATGYAINEGFATIARTAK